MPGLNTCGVNAAFNFKRFLEGVVLNIKPPRTPRGCKSQDGHPRQPVTVQNLQWVRRHMARSMSYDIMEQARGSGFRYLVEAIEQHSRRGNTPSCRAEDRLAHAFQDSRFASPHSLHSGNMVWILSNHNLSWKH